MLTASHQIIPSTEAALFARCVELLFSHAKAAILISLLVGAVFVGLMWAEFSHVWLLIWLATLTVVGVVRLWHVSAYFQAKPQISEARRWLVQYVAGSAVAAAFWGSAGVVFMPENHPLFQVFTLMLLTGLSAAAATTYSSVLWAYRVFLWVTMSPVGVMMLWKEDADHIAVGAVIFFYIIMMSQRAAVMVNKTVVESVRHSLRVAELLELNESIINYTDAGTVAYKPSGECVLMNNAAGEILGVSPSLGVKHNFRTNPSFQAFGVIELADKVMATGVDKAVEFSIRTINDYEVWVSARLHRIVQHGQPILLMVFNEIAPQRNPEYASTPETVQQVL